MDEVVQECYRRGQALYRAYKHEEGELTRRIAVHVAATRKSHARMRSILRRFGPLDATMVKAYRLLRQADAAKQAGNIYMNPHELKMMVRKMARVLYNQERSRKRAKEKEKQK